MGNPWGRWAVVAILFLAAGTLHRVNRQRRELAASPAEEAPAYTNLSEHDARMIRVEATVNRIESRLQQHLEREHFHLEGVTRGEAE